MIVFRALNRFVPRLVGAILNALQIKAEML